MFGAASGVSLVRLLAVTMVIATPLPLFWKQSCRLPAQEHVEWLPFGSLPA